MGSIPEWERSPGAGNGHPLPYSQPGKFHGQRSLGALWGPQDHKDLDTIEHKHIVALQCCVRFCYTAKLLNYIYFEEYISNIYIRFFSIICCYKILNIVPCVVGPCHLSILYICIYVSVNPKLCIYPFPPLP